MKFWPETATAVAVRLNRDGVIEVAAPLGLDDLFNLVVCPTERFRGEKHQIFLSRLRSKNWSSTWPKLKVIATR
jgi:hypothetical protein